MVRKNAVPYRTSCNRSMEENRQTEATCGIGMGELYLSIWYRHLYHFFNLKETWAPAYLFDEVPFERNVPYSLGCHHESNKIEELRVLQVFISKKFFLNGTCWMMMLKTPIRLWPLNVYYLQLSNRLKICIQCLQQNRYKKWCNIGTVKLQPSQWT